MKGKTNPVFSAWNNHPCRRDLGEFGVIKGMGSSTEEKG